MLAKILRNVMIRLDMRYGNYVSTNVKDNQQNNFKRCNSQRKGKDDER